MSSNGLIPVNMLWVGGPLGKIERLSLTSFVAQGHAVRLYTYAAVDDAPEGVEVRDGAAILPASVIEANRYANGSYALASNLFRYTLLAQNEGLWSDIDVVCIRPIRIDGPVIVGWEHEDWLNGAVLYWQADLPIAAEALAAFRPGHIPDWLGLRKRIGPRLRQLAGRPVLPRDLPHGTFGPKQVTALVKQHGLASYAQPADVFYPLPPRRATDAFSQSLRLEDIVTPRTLAIHLWNEKLRALKSTQPQQGSILHGLFERFGIRSAG